MNLHCQKAWQYEVRDSISVSMWKFNLQALPLAASAPAETPLSAFSNNADEDEVVGAIPLAVQAPSESTIPATSTIVDGIESVAETVPSLAVTTALSSTAVQVEADEPLPVAVNTALEVGAVGSPPVYVTAPLKPAPTIPSSSVKNESADKLPLAETTSNVVSPPVDTSNGFNSTESVQTGVELISGLNATAIVPSNTDVQGERPVDLVGLDLDGCSCHLDTEMVDVETKLLADEKPASSMETTKRRRSRRGSRKSRSKKQQLPLEKTSKSATSLTMEITSSTNCEAVRATSRTPLLTPHHEVDEGLAGTQSLGGTLPTETLVSPPTPGIEVQVLSNQPEVACAKSQSPTYVPADSAVAVDLTETKQSLTPLETEMEVESVDMVPVAEQAVNYVAEVQSVGPLLQIEAELVEPTSVTAGSVLSQTSVVETPNTVVDVETVEVVAVDTAVEAQAVAAPPVNVTEPPTKTVAQSVSPLGKTGVELHLGFDAAVNVSSTADVKRESSCHVMDAKMVDADSKLLVKERLETSSEATKLRKIRRGSRKRRSKKQLSLEKTSTPPTSQAVTCDVPSPITFIEVDTASAGTEQFIGTARSETSVSLQTSPGTDLEACHIQPEVACVQSVTATPALPDCAEDVDLEEAKQLSTPPNSELEGESIELAAVVEASSSSQTLVAEPSKEASEKDPAVVLAELAFGVLRTDVEEVAAPPVVTEPLMEAAPRSLSPTIGSSNRLGVAASAETGPELMCDSTASVSADNDDDLELIFAPVAVISKPLLTGPCKNVVVVETVDGKGNIIVEVQEVVAPQVCQTELPAESAPQTVSPPVGTAELVETGVELVLGKDAALNEPSVANEVEGESATHLVDNYSCNLGTEMVAVETKLPVDKKPASSLHTTKRQRSRRGSRKIGSKKQRLTLKETSTTPAPHTTTSEAACSEAPILDPAAPDSAEDVKLAETKQLSAPSYTEMETEPTPMAVASASCQSSIADSVQVESVVSVHGAPIQSRSSCALPVIKAAPSGCSLPPSTDTEHVLPVITMPEGLPGSSLVGETPSAPPSSLSPANGTSTRLSVTEFAETAPELILAAPPNVEMEVDDMEAAVTPVEEEGVTKFVGNPSYNAVELQSVDPLSEMDAEPSLLEVVSVPFKTPVTEPSNNAADVRGVDAHAGEGIVPASSTVTVETALAGSFTAFHTESEMATSANVTSDAEFQGKRPTDLVDKRSCHSDTEMVDVEKKLLVDEKPAASVEATKRRRSRRRSRKSATRKQQMPLEKTSTPLKSKAVEATPLTAPCTEVEDGPASTEQVLTARPEMCVSLQMTPEIDLQASEIIPEAADVSSFTPAPPPPDSAEDVKLAVTKQLDARLNFEMRVDDREAAETPVEEEGVTKFVGNPSYNAVEVQSVDPLPEMDAERSLLEVVSVPSKTPVTEPSNNAADVEAIDALVGEGIVAASTAVGVETALDRSFTALETESAMANSANVTSDAEFQGKSLTDLVDKRSHHSDTEMVDVEKKLLVDEKPAASVEATKRRRSRRRSRKSAATKQQMPLEKTNTPLKSKAVEATPLTALCIEVEDGPAEQVTATAGRPETSVCVPTTPEIVLEACDNQPEAADVPSRTPTPALPVGEADADLAEAESIELAAVVEASSLSQTLVAEPSKKASEKDPAVVLAELAFGVLRTDVEEVAAPPVVTEPLMEAAPRSLSPTIGSSTRLGVTASAETGPELMCDSTASVSGDNDDDLELIFAPVAVISKPLLTGPCKNVVVVETVDGKGNIVVEVQEVVAPQVCQTELPAESAPQTVSPPVGTAELVETGVELVLGKDAALNEPSVANEVEGESATHLVDNYSCNLGREMVAVETKLPVDKKPASSLHTTKRQRSRRGSRKSGSKKQRLTLKETSPTSTPHTATSEAACSEAAILTVAAPDSAEDVKLAETKQLSAPSYTEMEVEPTPMAVASASCQSLIADRSNNSVQVESVVSVHGAPIQSRSSCALPVIKAAPSGCSLPPSTDTEHVLPVITMPESLPGSSLVGETPSSTASESAIVVGSVVVEIGSLDSLPSEGPVSFVGWKSSDSKVSDQDPLGSRNPSLRKVRPTLESGRSSCKGVSRKWGVLKDQAKPESDTSSTICNTLGTISKPDELECDSSNEQLVPETVISYIPVCPPATSDMNIDIAGGLQFSTAEVLAPLVLTNVVEKKSAKDILETVVDTQSVERETEKVHVDTSPFQGQKRGSNEVKRGKKRKRSSCNKGIDVDSVAAYVEVTTSPATESVESSKKALVLNHPAKDMLECALPVGETAPTVPSDTVVTKQAAEAMMECAFPGSETAPTVPSNTLVSFQAAKAMLEGAFCVGETAPTVPSDTSYTKEAAEAMLECALPVGETAPTVPSNTLVSFQEAKAVLECAFSVGETAPTVPSNSFYTQQAAEAMLECALPVGETAPTVPSNTLHTKQAAKAMLECAFPVGETAPTVPSNTLHTKQAAEAMLECALPVGETAPTVPRNTLHTKQAAEAMLECALPVGETAPTVPSNTRVPFQAAEVMMECALPVGETAPTMPSNTLHTKQAAEAMLECAFPVGETAPTVPSNTLHTKQAAEAMLECAFPVGETAPTVPSNTLHTKQAAEAMLECALPVGETAPTVPSNTRVPFQAAEVMLECALPVGETAPTVPSNTLHTKQAAEAMLECAFPVGETAPTVPSNTLHTKQAAEAMLECALPVGETAPTVPSNTLHTKQAAEAMLECAFPVGETAPTVPSNTLHTKQAAEAMLECALPVGETAPTVPSNTLHTKQAAEAMLECAFPVDETAPTVPSNTLHTKQAAEAMLECAFPVGETAPTVRSNTRVPFQAAEVMMECALPVGETAPTVPSNTLHTKQAAEAMLECALPVGETAPTVPSNTLHTKQAAEAMLECALPVGETAPTVPSNTWVPFQAAEVMMECALPVGETAPTVPSNTFYMKQAAEAMLEYALPMGEIASTVPSNTLVTKQAAEVMMECALPLGETAPAVSSNTHVSFQKAKAVLECAFSAGETAPTVPSNTFYMKQAAEAMLECALPVGETTLTVPSDNLHTRQGAEDMLECAFPVGETAPTVPSNTRASFQAAKAVLERAFSVGEAAPTVPSKTLHMKQAAEAMLESASPVGETAPAVPSNTRASFQAAKAALERAFSVGEAAPTVPSKTLHMKQTAEAMLECSSPVGETAPAVPSNTRASFQAAKAALERAFSTGEAAPTVPSKTLHMKQAAEAMLECSSPVGETAPAVPSNTRASFQAAKVALESAFSVGEAAPTVPSKTLHMKQAAEAMLESASPVGETAPAVPSDTLMRKQVSGAMLECVLPVSETALPVTNNALGESKETSCRAPEIKQTRKRKRSDLESEDRDPQKSSQKEEGCEDSQKVDSETVDEIIKPLEIKTNRQKSKSKRASQKSGRKKLQSVPQRSEGDSVAVASSSTEPLPDQNGTTKSDSSPVLLETEMVCMD